MNTSILKYRTYLIVLLLSISALSMAVPLETEYRGVLVQEGYLDEGIFGAPIGFNFEFYGNTYSTLFINRQAE